MPSVLLALRGDARASTSESAVLHDSPDHHRQATACGLTCRTRPMIQPWREPGARAASTWWGN